MNSQLIRKSNLIRHIIINDNNVEALSPLFVFPKIVKNIQNYLDIKSIPELEPIITSEINTKYNNIRNSQENNIINRYIKLIQNTQAYFMILSYLNFIPFYPEFKIIPFNPMTCQACPILINLSNPELITTDRGIYCTLKCFMENNYESKINPRKYLTNKRKRSINPIKARQDEKQDLQKYFMNHTNLNEMSNKQIINFKNNIKHI